jgi:hypothetical protein
MKNLFHFIAQYCGIVCTSWKYLQIQNFESYWPHSFISLGLMWLYHYQIIPMDTRFST